MFELIVGEWPLVADSIHITVGDVPQPGFVSLSVRLRGHVIRDNDSCKERCNKNIQVWQDFMFIILINFWK